MCQKWQPSEIIFTIIIRHVVKKATLSNFLGKSTSAQNNIKSLGAESKTLISSQFWQIRHGLCQIDSSSYSPFQYVRDFECFASFLGTALIYPTTGLGDQPLSGERARASQKYQFSRLCHNNCFETGKMEHLGLISRERDVQRRQLVIILPLLPRRQMRVVSSALDSIHYHSRWFIYFHFSINLSSFSGLVFTANIVTSLMKNSLGSRISQATKENYQGANIKKQWALHDYDDDDLLFLILEIQEVPASSCSSLPIEPSLCQDRLEPKQKKINSPVNGFKLMHTGRGLDQIDSYRHLAKKCAYYINKKLF